MTRKSITELYTQATETIQDNTTGEVSPADVRQLIQDFLDTIRPSYGGCAIDATGVSKAVTTAFSPFVWETLIDTGSADWNSSAASGSAYRSNGPATTRITFSADVVAPNNMIVTFTLFKNGVATPWSISLTSTSSTDIQAVSLAGLDYEPGADINYQMQVKGSVNGNIVISNAAFMVENVPVDAV